MGATDGGWKDQGPAPASWSSGVPVTASLCVWTSFPHLERGMQRCYQAELDLSKPFLPLLQSVDDESPPSS